MGNVNGGTLNDRQASFVEYYLDGWNATQAAIDAGYAEKSARMQASRLLTKDNIKERIRQRMVELSMGPEEVIRRLTEQASTNASYFLTETGAVDWDKVKKQGHLIKKIKHTKGKHSEIELYDAQAALSLIGRRYALFTDKRETTLRGDAKNPIAIGVVKMDVDEL